MKVFVIEQRRETLERIVRLLKDMRHEVTTFTDGREGAESVTTLKPDLILIDADINQGLGLKIAERLKREESTMLIPVILLTTPYKSKEFIEGAMAARIDGFLFLPFDEMDFHTKVHVGMRLKAYADETVAQKDTLSELSDTIAERDEELRAKDDHIAELEKELALERSTDALTGLFNRREFLKRLEALVYESIRFEESIVLFLYDIDHLNIINKEFGREIGDGVLLELSKIVLAHCRKEDIIGRFGDDEFIVAYKRMREDFIEPIADRLKNAIEACEITVGELRVKFTACVGISCNKYFKSYRFDEIEEPLEEALIAVRNAKRRGGGSVYIHPLIKKV